MIVSAEIIVTLLLYCSRKTKDPNVIWSESCHPSLLRFIWKSLVTNALGNFHGLPVAYFGSFSGPMRTNLISDQSEKRTKIFKAKSYLCILSRVVVTPCPIFDAMSDIISNSFLF